MPRLSRTIPNLKREGPLLRVQVEPVLASQKAMLADGEEVPSISAVLLIDTGASGTLVQTDVINRLGLESLGTVFLRTPTTTEPVARSQYLVRIVLLEGIAFEVEVVDAPLTGQGIQGLIGRDILDQLVFTYDGPENQLVVTYGE